MKNKNVAIVGATGAVGCEFVGCIESRGLPLASLKLLASAKSAGKTQAFRGKDLVVEELTERIALLTSEIERLQTAMTKKRASRDAADRFFKS